MDKFLKHENDQNYWHRLIYCKFINKGAFAASVIVLFFHYIPK